MVILQCSIDSLLERTIKHMLFLQSITKHADKLNKCADAKVNVFGQVFYALGLVDNFQPSFLVYKVGSIWLPLFG